MSATPSLSPLGTPEAWYFVGLGAELAAGAVRVVRLAGEDWVLWRGMDGMASLTASTCPHLGAHLGEGGTVQGNELRCPFHGFRFSTSGQCTATGYDTKPPRAVLRALPLQEKNGLLFVWWSGCEAAPTWEVPEVDMAGWSPFQVDHWSMPGHPQETTENSVDHGHFGWIHGYSDVRVLREIRAEGPLLEGRYAFKRPLVRGVSWLPLLSEEFDFEVWGLGYTRVEVFDQTAGLRIRLLVMATVTEPGEVELHVAASVLDLDRTEGFLRHLPTAMVRPILVPIVLSAFRGEVEQDAVIWKRKRYLPQPALARGDGPVAMYRAWAKQFYGNPSPAVPDAALEVPLGDGGKEN